MVPIYKTTFVALHTNAWFYVIMTMLHNDWSDICLVVEDLSNTEYL